MHLPLHAISLLVHERLDVVVDQCRNFQAFAPASVVMIHVSASASFTREALQDALAAAGIKRALVNPVSRASRWGNILYGHFENIRALDGMLNAGATVSLHASNDLLLQPLPEGVDLLAPRFETRPVTRSTLWYTGRQFAKSAAFDELLTRLDCAVAAGGQVEGSVYPYATLVDLVKAAEPYQHLIEQLPLVAEETLFPSWGVSRLGKADYFPYVLFRQPRLPAAAVALVPPPLRASRLVDKLHSGANRVAVSRKNPDGRAEDVEAIIAGTPIRIAAWAQGAAPRGHERFLGIKRIARTMDDPIRQRIGRHTSAYLAASGRAN